MSYQVRHSFDERFMTKLKDIEAKYGAEMIELDGIGPSKLDINQFAKEFFKKGVAVADVSVDGNGNVEDSSVLSFEYEFTKSIQKLNSYYILWKDMVENPELGIKRANKCLELMVIGELKLHDAHGVSKPYCYSFDLEPLVSTGLPFIQKIKIGPPKHFSSFINLIIQFTAFASNQLMGAIAYPNLFVYADWFARRDYGENYLDNEEIRTRVQQDIQSLVYSFSFPFRGSQSSFVNLNSYDKYFMKDLFGNMFYSDGSKPNLESIDKLQKFYMEWFVEESKTQTFTFPVNTATFYKNGNGDIQDKDFLKYISNLNCVNGVFNIFTGELGVLASCCFSGDEVIQVKNKNTNVIEIMTIKSFIELFSDDYVDEEIETNYTIISHNKETGESEETDITGILKKRNEYDELIEFVVNGKSIQVTPDHIMMVKDIEKNEVIELTAKEVSEHQNRYLIPCE